MRKARPRSGKGQRQDQADSSPSQSILAVILLSAVVLAFYSRLWLPGHVLIYRDAFRSLLPIKQYAVERLLAGELPQWIPYEGFGLPFLSVPNTGIFHPFTLLYFFLPPWDGLRLSVLLSCLLGTWGVFALSRAYQMSLLGSCLAGMVFSLSGYVASDTEALTNLYSVCMLPWFLLGLKKAVSGSWAWIAAPAASWASVFLNGDIFTGYCYGLISIVWMAHCAEASEYRQVAVRLVAVVCLAGLLAGIQLAPAVGAYPENYRASPIGARASTDFATHPWRLLTILASPVGGSAASATVAHAFFGGNPSDIAPVGYWVESLYLGLPIVGLALLGVWSRRDLRTIGLIGLIALLLALGRRGGIYPLFHDFLPFWSAFRFPERLMGIATFSLAMLAGAGLDVLRAGHGRYLAWGLISLGFAGMGSCLLMPTAGNLLSDLSGARLWLAIELAQSAGKAGYWSGSMALGTAVVAWACQKQWRQREVFVVLLLAAIACDLSRANVQAYHTGPSWLATMTPGLVDALKEAAGPAEPGRFRIFSVPSGRSVIPDPLPKQIGEIGEFSLSLLQMLEVEHNVRFHIESLRGYLPGLNQAFSTFISQTLDPELLGRLNVGWFTGPTENFHERMFANVSDAFTLQAYELSLVRNPVAVKPRAYLSLRPERSLTGVEIASLAERSDFRSGEVDVIEAPDIRLPDGAQGGTVNIERYSPEEVIVRVETSQEAVLVLQDSFHSGWMALLDESTEIQIWRANGIVRAVMVPEGRHSVTFKYRTPYLGIGALATLVGIVLCLGLVLRFHWRIRRATQTVPSSQSAT